MNTTIKQYFANKASKYDDVDLQPYWLFSDELLWYILQNKIFSKNNNTKFNFLDVGAGTGRWSIKTLEAYPNSYASLVDISHEMIDIARLKLEKKIFTNRFNIEIDDARQLNHIKDKEFDIIFCLHNVIGFFDETIIAISNFYKKLKENGKCAVMFPSYYHSIYFSNTTNRIEQLDEIEKNHKVQYNDTMPPLKVFEISDIEYLQKESGFKNVSCYGFPITLYPGMEETFVHGSTANIVNLLESNHQSKLLEIEKKLCLQSKLSSRGNNIIAIFEK